MLYPFGGEVIETIGVGGDKGRNDDEEYPETKQEYSKTKKGREKKEGTLILYQNNQRVVF